VALQCIQTVLQIARHSYVLHALQVEIQVKDLATAEQVLRQELAEERRRSSSGAGCISMPCMNPAAKY
jgi:hypothetical protein